MKRLTILLAGLLAILLVSVHDLSAEAPRRKVRIGWLPANMMTVPYADYIGAWQKEGLEVEVKKFQGGPAIVEAVMAGALDAADIGYVPMIYAATRGLPLYFLASDGISTPERPMFPLTVAPDSTIKSFRELKGKTIALHQRGTMQDAFLSAACDKYGMNRSDLKITLVPFPQQGGVLAHKQVDATFSGPPFDTLQVLNKQGKVLFDMSEVMHYTAISGLAVSRKFADENPELTRKLVKGYVNAGRWVNDNEKTVREKVWTDKRYFELPSEVAALVHMPYWPRNGYHPMPSVWSIYNLMVKFNLIQPWDNPEAKMKEYWIDPTLKYTVPAVKELGVQDDPYMNKLLLTSLPYLDKKLQAYSAPWNNDEPASSAKAAPETAKKKGK